MMKATKATKIPTLSRSLRSRNPRNRAWKETCQTPAQWIEERIAQLEWIFAIDRVPGLGFRRTNEGFRFPQ